MRDRSADVRENGFTDLVLVCTNDRDSEYAACATADGPAVYEAVTTWLRERGVFWSRVFVAETTCLGLCSADGTAMAIQPRNRWFSDVRPEEVPDLLAEAFGPDATDLGVRTSVPADATPPTDTG